MNSKPVSLKVFGIYLILVPGIGLMFFPGLILDLFQLRFDAIYWLPRMVGLLALIIGVFDYSIGYFRVSPLYIHTVVLRIFAALFMVSLWLLKEVEVMILLFAAVDAGGALWTLLAKR